MKFKSNYITPVGTEGIYILNTGDWRTKRPILNQDKCIKCGLCFLYCPVNSIKKEREGFAICYDYCKGCGICSYECPQNAINMILEEGE